MPSFVKIGWTALGFLGSSFGLSPAEAASYRYITLDPPGTTSSAGVAINDAGQVVVTSGDDAYVWQSGIFTRLAFPPGTSPVHPTSISPWGLVVGSVYKPVNDYPKGFAYSTIKDQAYSLNIRHLRTEPAAINGAGQVTGAVFDTNGSFHAFLYRYGTYDVVNPPGASLSSGSWLNDSGLVVGSAVYPSAGLNNALAFAYQAGRYSVISVPEAHGGTFPTFVNNSGVVTGLYLQNSPDDTATHGFILSGGKYVKVDYPGFPSSAVVAMNLHGEAIGVYGVSSSHYRAFRISGGKIQSASPPGATYATVAGINEADLFVGTYRGSAATNAKNHAFVAVCDPVGSRCGD